MSRWGSLMSNRKKLISVVTPCFNEENNVSLLSERVSAAFKSLSGYEYEHIFADNASEDNTLTVLREMAKSDRKIKIIANTANFGPIKSVFNAVLSASGDAVVVLSADLQDPPELIPQFVEKWEEGYKVVFAIREKRSEFKLLGIIRKLYYRILRSISDDQLVNDAGDFLLFDKDVLNVLKGVRDTNPYLRGLISSLGFKHAGIKYHMPPRHSGKSSTNLFRLYVYALNGFVNHTMFPLRLATLLGLLMSSVCIGFAFLQLVLKIFFWERSAPGVSTVVVSLFFLSGVQLFLLGFLGEFVGSIHKQIKGLPLVIEKERINFDVPVLPDLKNNKAKT